MVTSQLVFPTTGHRDIPLTPSALGEGRAGFSEAVSTHQSVEGSQLHKPPGAQDTQAQPRVTFSGNTRASPLCERSPDPGVTPLPHPRRPRHFLLSPLQDLGRHAGPSHRASPALPGSCLSPESHQLLHFCPRRAPRHMGPSQQFSCPRPGSSADRRGREAGNQRPAESKTNQGQPFTSKAGEKGLERAKSLPPTTLPRRPILRQNRPERRPVGWEQTQPLGSRAGDTTASCQE